MTGTGGFEPTQPQDGVDSNMFTLIDPEAIPYPLTDVWSLNYAAETLRTGGEDIAGGAEDMRSTWQGLQAHYSAPESETLFAKMNPVVTRGEDLHSDLDTVAGALEDLAEAAKTARGKLNLLRIQAQGLWNRHQHKKVWWLTKDEETDGLALEENIRLKDAVNAAWATFNEAENDCASRISAVFGGPAYASPDQAGGTDLVYGLPTDAGERQMPGFDETFMDPANDLTAWLGSEFHPSLARFDNSTGQAIWDVVVTDALWGSAVGLVAMSGMWHPEGGWRLTPQGRWDNLKRSGNDALLDMATFVGVHDEHGWLWEPGEDGQGGGRSTWDRWTTNAWASAGEWWEAHTAWSQRDEDPEYSNATIGTNVVMMTGGLPLKLAKTLLGLGPGGSSVTSSPSDGSFSHGSSSGPTGSTSGRGPGTSEWPSSPLPRDGTGGDTSTSGRFTDQLTVLRESLLDPDRHRPAPSSQPDRPSPTPDRPDQRSDTPTPTTRPDTDSQSGNSDTSPADRSPEQRPQGRRDDDLGDQGDGRTPRDDDDPQNRSGPREEAKNPEPATGGGEGGGEQPPKDRTGTGGDDGDGDRGDDTGGRDEPPQDGKEDSDNSSETSDVKREETLRRAEEINEKLRTGGLTQEQIDLLRGDLSMEDRDWQRMYSAMNRAFSEKIMPQLHPLAVDFAYEGASNSKEFSYRYEYFTSTYKEISKELVATGEFGKKNSKTEAARMIVDGDIDIVARLEADHKEVRSARPDSGPITVDRRPDKTVASIREHAGAIHMGHETSAAYHARKHPEAVPVAESTGNPIRDYLDSAERTLREGQLVERTPADGGSEKLVFTRPLLDEDGVQIIDSKGNPMKLEAILYLRPDSSIVLATFDRKTGIR